MVILLLLFNVVRALSESLPPPHVDNWQLTWTPGTQDRNVSYSVQYSTSLGVGEPVWENVEDCVQTSLNSCNVSFTKAKESNGCVMLRVQAMRDEQASEQDACSTHSDSCTPEVNLTAHTGSLTVILNKRHSLYRDYADGVNQRIYFGKEGEPLEEYGDFFASHTIDNLEPGQRYCVRVQYVRLDRPIGLSTCPQCEVIPLSRLKQSNIIVAVVVSVAVLIALVTAIVYILIVKLEKIKRWLQLPMRVPPDFHDRFNGPSIPIYIRTPTEEVFDTISDMIPNK